MNPQPIVTLLDRMRGVGLTVASIEAGLRADGWHLTPGDVGRTVRELVADGVLVEQQRGRRAPTYTRPSW